MSISVGILGGAGYTAGELIRILCRHPEVTLKSIASESHAGKPVSSVHGDLEGDIDLYFGQELHGSADVIFLCRGHGASRKWMAENSQPASQKIIDLSTDFRLKGPNNPFVYGLPELERTLIQKSDRVANPGCFATAIQLSMLPLAAGGVLKGDIHVNAITGSTGAGQGLAETSHFSWRNNNLSVYKAFRHQHLDEIQQSLRQLMPGFAAQIFFIPTRGNFTRGIFSTTVVDCQTPEEECFDLYESYYKSAPFTHVSRENISLKQVVNTNKCLIHLQRYNDKLLIICAIDNLLKGASGQAVQNMNLMCGIPEVAGLQLKGMAY
jgi:N-acetyl-gamma-glutamyl-phosphate reductase